MAGPADFSTPDFLKAGFGADPQKADFFRQYQALAKQSWEAWLRQASPSAAPVDAPAQAGAGNAALDRALDGLKRYFDWLQGTTAAPETPAGGDWQQQLRQWFDGFQQPFTQAFGGIAGAGAEGFGPPWQDWMQVLQKTGADATGPTPAFGLDREQQMQYQALGAAMAAALQANGRYQALIQRANTEGMQRLQAKLATPGRQVESLKALYDLWVDAAEEAYAQIALTEEFRDAYGDMVNSQMRVQQLQRQQTEHLCRQWGLPGRSEIATLGERLQQARRELRATHAQVSDHAREIDALRRELAALKRGVAGGASAPATKPVRVAAPVSAVKKAIPKKAAAPKAARAGTKAATAPRKRK